MANPYQLVPGSEDSGTQWGNAINAYNLAIAQKNSGAGAPTDTASLMWWYDTGNDLLKIRNEADDTWIDVWYIPAANDLYQVGPLLIYENSDTIKFTHNGTDVYWQTDDGEFYVKTDEGANTDTVLNIEGKGAAKGILKFWDDSKTNFTKLQTADAQGVDITYTLPTTDGGANEVLTTDGAGVLSWAAGGGGGSVENMLINGDMRVWQRGTSFTAATTPANNDDTYLADRWNLLSDGNDVVDVSRETTQVPDAADSGGGGYASIKLDVQTASTGFGIAQIIEGKNCIHTVSGAVSLRFQAMCPAGNTTLKHLRAAVLAEGGAEDTCTSDVVSAWANPGANHTWAAGLTALNTASTLSCASGSTWYEFKIENISVTSGANLTVFLWADTDATAGDVVYLTNVQLEAGATANSFATRDFTDELQRCQRYYYKTFDYGTAPVQALGAGNAELHNCGVIGGRCELTWEFKASMRTAPTITTYNPVVANASWRNASDGTNSVVGVVDIGTEHATITGDGGADDAGNRLIIHAAADAEL